MVVSAPQSNVQAVGKSGENREGKGHPKETGVGGGETGRHRLVSSRRILSTYVYVLLAFRLLECLKMLHFVASKSIILWLVGYTLKDDDAQEGPRHEGG